MSELTTIDTCDLDEVQGGSWLTQFVRGAAGGFIHGPNAKTEQIDQFGNRGSTGFKPGVEVGMMANMALGPAGRLLTSIFSKTLPTGG